MSPLVLFLVCAFGFGNSLRFHRELFGVEFSPYVKRAEGHAPTPLYSTYKLKNAETMLKVICTKFSRIVTISVGAYDVPYKKNYSYYVSANVRARIAEAAAIVNLRKKQRCMTVLIGIWDGNYSYSQKMETEVNIAVEAANIANEIFPGTVERLVLTNFDITEISWAKSNLYWIRALKRMTSDSGLKIGFRQNCPYAPLEENSTIADFVRNMITISDFVICDTKPVKSTAMYGAKFAFDILQRNHLDARFKIQYINNKIEVMLMTTWVSAGQNEWENIDDFREFWLQLNEFALDENYPVYMVGAFDTIVNSPRGWWKLIQNDLINNVTGYLEKESGKQITLEEVNGISTNNGYHFHNNPDPRNVKNCEESNKHVVLGVVVSVATLLVILALGVCLCRRFCLFYDKNLFYN